MRWVVIGVDPGPAPGICVLICEAKRLVGTPAVIQCSQHIALSIIRLLIDQAEPHSVLIAGERYVVRARAARSRTPQAAQITRDLNGQLETLASERVRVVQRAAAQVMPWATNERLVAAGLWQPTVGVKDARAAARHALYATCYDLDVTDPLSRRGGSDEHCVRSGP